MGSALIRKLAEMKPLPMPTELSGLKHLPNLKRVREERGLTREDLAHCTGISISVIQRAEGGIATHNGFGITLYTAIAIAEVLGTGLDELTGLCSSKKPKTIHDNLIETVTNYGVKR